jgi:chromosome partitioning protein
VTQVIAITNQKGGTGKTTTAVNLGCALGKLGKKVLLIDMDPQASLTYYFGIHKPKAGIADVLMGDYDWKDVIIPKEDVWVAPGGLDLADTELSLATYEGREFVLKRSLESLHGFDMVVLDCPPALSLLTLNALTASDFAVIPVQLEVLGVQGLSLIMNTISRVRKKFNPNIHVLGVALVMVDIRKRVTQEIYQLLRNHGLPLFRSHIELDERAVEAPSFGQSLLEYAPKSLSGAAYVSLAREVLGGIREYEQKKSLL